MNVSTTLRGRILTGLLGLRQLVFTMPSKKYGPSIFVLTAETRPESSLGGGTIRETTNVLGFTTGVAHIYLSGDLTDGGILHSSGQRRGSLFS